MSAMTRKSWRDISTRKVRSLLVVLSIAAGVFGLSSIMSVSDLLIDVLNESYRNSRPAHMIISVEGIPQDTLNALEKRLPNVRTLEGRMLFSTRWKVEDKWELLNVIGVADFNDMKLNVTHKTEGEYPRKDSLLVEQSVKEILPVAIGKEVVIEIPGRDKTFVISGFAHSPGHPSASYIGQSTAYVSLEGAKRLTGREGFNTVLVELEDFKKAEETEKEIRRKFRKMGIEVLAISIQDPDRHPVQEVVRMIFSIIGALGAVSFFLSGFLVINTISAILAEQIPQIGAMKAIGATSRQVMRIYFISVSFYGLLAVLLATPLSAISGYALTSYLAGLANIDMGRFVISLRALLFGLLIGLIVPLASAFFPILSGTRVTIREAISSYGITVSFGQSPIDRLLERIKGLPRPMLLSLRNTFRRKRRALLTITSLTIAGVAFIAVRSTDVSLSQTLEVVLDTYDMDLQIAFPSPVRTERAMKVARRLHGISKTEGWYWARATIEGVEVIMPAPPPETTIYKKRLVSGRWFSSTDKGVVVISQVVAQINQLTVGDVVTVEVGGKEEKWRIVGIVKDYNNSGNVAFVPKYQLLRAMGLGDRSIVLFAQANRESGQYVKDIAERAYEAFSKAGMRVSISTASQIKREALKPFQIIIAFLMTMVVLIAAVGGLGLFGSLTINVMERRREIGVMRSIGATSGTIAQIFLTEGMFLAVISWFIACALSYPVARWFTHLLGEILFGMKFSFPVSGIGVWLIIVLILATISSIGPALQAARMRIREIISYE